MFLVFLTYALFASIFTVGKMALSTLPPFFITGIRYLLAGIFLCSFGALKGYLRKFPPWPHIPILLGIGIFNVFLTNGLEFWGMQYLSSGRTCLFYSMSPFYSVILSYFCLNEKMTLRKWIGLIIGILGFIILIMEKDLSESENHLWKIGNFSIAEIAVSFSAFSAVLGWIFFKKLTDQKKYPIILSNGYSFIIGGLLGMLISFIYEPFSLYQTSHNSSTLLWQIIYITIVHSIICYSLYANALRTFSVTFMMFAGITNPMFAALYGWIFINEEISKNFILCILLVGFGLYLFYLDERKNNS